jgi:hypothetical protein
MVPYYCLMNANGSGGGHYVELLEAKFLGLLRQVVKQVDVDEDWYLASYTDVAEAVRSGALKSARSHYVRAGYFENRLPRPVKVQEDWYMAEYPDVAVAIRNGAFTSATHHFESDGFKEGRLPEPGWSLLGNNAEDVEF